MSSTNFQSNCLSTAAGPQTYNLPPAGGPPSGHPRGPPPQGMNNLFHKRGKIVIMEYGTNPYIGTAPKNWLPHECAQTEVQNYCRCSHKPL